MQPNSSATLKQKYLLKLTHGKEQETFAKGWQKLTCKGTFCITMVNDEVELILGKSITFLANLNFLCSESLIAQINGIMKNTFSTFKSET